MKRVSFGFFLILCFLSSAAWGNLSEEYPGDVGIENDPAVVFHEDFEAPDIDTIRTHWDEARHPENMFLMSDVPPTSSGSQSLQMRCIGGERDPEAPNYNPLATDGGHFYTRLSGYDQIYARFYTKIPSNSHPFHHFVTLGGYNPPSPWPMGNAGFLPDGDLRWNTGIEPHGSDWEWDFYTYWNEMHSWAADPDNTYKAYYGNRFHPTPNVPVVREEWVCVELIVKMNDATDSRNGEQAFMIDGVLGQHLGEGFPNGYWTRDKFWPDENSPPFEGFRWRTDLTLNINYFWLMYYMTTAPEGETHHVLFDDVVLATEYVGCHDRGPSEDPTLHEETPGSSTNGGDEGEEEGLGSGSDEILGDSFGGTAVSSGCGSLSRNFSLEGVLLFFFGVGLIWLRRPHRKI